METGSIGCWVPKSKGKGTGTGRMVPQVGPSGFSPLPLSPLLVGLYPSCASVIGWSIISRFFNFLFSDLLMESLINFDSTNLEPMILQDKTCDRCLKKQAKQTSFQGTPYCTPRVWICRDQSLSTLAVVRLIRHQVGEEAQPASVLEVVLTQGQKVPRFHVLQFFSPSSIHRCNSLIKLANIQKWSRQFCVLKV